METNEMIAKAEKSLKSQPGYRYNARVLEEVITAGVIHDGAILYQSGRQSLTYEAGEVINRIDGKVERRVPASEGEALENAIIAHAIYRARTELS